MKINFAIILTLIRILAVPVVVLCFYSPIPYARPVAGLVFGLSAITDLLDGYIARRFNQTSRLGEFLDPVADKLTVAIAMILLVQSDPRSTIDFIAMIIIGREITVSALREWMATIGERANVKVSWGGKIKTTLQMFGISFMLYQKPILGIDVFDVGFVLLLLAAGMTLWSMFVYLRAAWPSMQADL